MTRVGETDRPDQTLAPLVHELANISNGFNLHGERVRLLIGQSDLVGAEQAIADVLREGDRLVRVIEGIRRLQHVADGIELHAWSTGALLTLAVEKVLAMGVPSRPTLRVASNPDELPKVLGEPGALAGLLQELASNAAAAGASRLDIGFAADRDAVAIEITDDGTGVEAPMQQRMFTMFASSRKHEGHLGLGLWRARAIAAVLGGELNLVGSEPGWTCFRLRLATTTS